MRPTAEGRKGSCGPVRTPGSRRRARADALTALAPCSPRPRAPTPLRWGAVLPGRPAGAPLPPAFTAECSIPRPGVLGCRRAAAVGPLQPRPVRGGPEGRVDVLDVGASSVCSSPAWVQRRRRSPGPRAARHLHAPRLCPHLPLPLHRPERTGPESPAGPHRSPSARARPPRPGRLPARAVPCAPPARAVPCAPPARAVPCAPLACLLGRPPLPGLGRRQAPPRAPLTPVAAESDPDTSSRLAPPAAGGDSAWPRTARAGVPTTPAPVPAQRRGSSVMVGASLGLPQPCLLLSIKTEEMRLFMKQCVYPESAVTGRVNLGLVRL